MQYNKCILQKCSFFHPDYTVGFGIAPNHAQCARGLYRQSGITPCPEELLMEFIIFYDMRIEKAIPMIGCI